MSESEESEDHSDGDNSLDHLTLRQEVHRETKERQIGSNSNSNGNSNNNNNNRTRKTSLENRRAPRPVGARRSSLSTSQSSIGVILQTRSSGSSAIRDRRRGSTGSNRRSLKRIVSESSLNTSSNIFKNTSMTNDTWDSIETRQPRVGGKRLEKRGLLDAEDEDDQEEEKSDTIAPLGGKGNNNTSKSNNIFKRAANLKRFGLNKSETDNSTTTIFDSNNNKQLRNLFQKAASMRVLKSKWDGFDEMSKGSDEFSLHSMSSSRQSSHQQQLLLQQPQEQPEQKQQQQQSRPEGLSSLGQSLRRLNDMDPNVNHNTGSSTRLGDSSNSWSVDAEYSIASPTLWTENSEEMKPGLQFAPSTEATLLAQRQNLQPPAQPVEEPKNKIGQSSIPLEPKPPSETASISATNIEADVTNPKIGAAVESSEKPPDSSPEAVDGKGKQQQQQQRPTRKLKRGKSKTGTKSKGKKKKAPTSKKNVMGGGDMSGDSNDEMEKESPVVVQSKRLTKNNNPINLRKKRKGGRRKNRGSADNTNNPNTNTNNQLPKEMSDGMNRQGEYTDEEADEIHTEDEDSDIMSMTSEEFEDDLEKPRSFSRSQSPGKPQSLSRSSSQRSEKLSKSYRSQDEVSSKPQSHSKSSQQNLIPPAPTKGSSSNNSRLPRDHRRFNKNSDRRLNKPQTGSLSPKTISKPKAYTKKILSESADNLCYASFLEDSDEESKASKRRISRREELRESKLLFPSSPKSRQQRRRSVGAGLVRATSGGDKKGYISSFLGVSAKTPG